MNNKQYNAVVDYFKEYSPFGVGDEDEVEEDAVAAADVVDSILKENEVTSKPVMPEVFDDWYKERGFDPYDFEVWLNTLIADMDYPYYGFEMRLSQWVDDNDEGLKRCVEALLYGYEVEK